MTTLNEWIDGSNHFGNILNKLKQDPEQFCRDAEKIENKVVENWGSVTFLRYFYKLRSIKYGQLESRNDAKYRGMVKTIIERCASPKEAKNFFDNSVINFDAIKEKYGWKFRNNAYPTIESILYNFNELIDDVRKTGGTVSRTHRVNPLAKENGDTNPW